MMKKTYETPTLQTERFDVEDVITASGLDTVGGGKTGMEILIGGIQGVIQSFSGE